MPKKLTEIEAAILVRMSPELLRELTKTAPKHGESRKLPFTEIDGEITYSDEELLEFDRYLKAPWPRPLKSKRPHLPKCIRDELVIEANHKCAFCSWTNTGEAAHIDPVHESPCHHPHNLIWTCPNHHTEYDYGQIKVTLLTRAHVRVMKEFLLDARVRQWRVEHRSVSDCLAIIETLRKIAAYLDDKGFSGIRSELSEIATRSLDSAISNAKKGIQGTAKAKRPKSYIHYAEKVAALTSLPKAFKTAEINETVQTLENARDTYFSESNLELCPLCKGKGDHNHHTCPICAGDGSVEKDRVAELDLKPFTQIKCPLCKGSGEHNRFECPVCRGVSTIDQGAVVELDLSPYAQKVCPVCEGSGSHNRKDCWGCAGVGTIDKAREIEHDLFRQVECPICDGGGDRDGGDCPECHGVGTIDAAREETLDANVYRQDDCPICLGKGYRKKGRPCAACQTTGKMDAGRIELLDTSLYGSVECPHCHGTGEANDRDCSFCSGGGEVDAAAAENYDPPSGDFD